MLAVAAAAVIADVDAAHQCLDLTPRVVSHLPLEAHLVLEASWFSPTRPSSNRAASVLPPSGKIIPSYGTSCSTFLKHGQTFIQLNFFHSCGFDVEEGHTSMTCPFHLRKPGHGINFFRQNAQQYIVLCYPCSTKNCHKTMLPTM